jgi:hypothetical protein
MDNEFKRAENTFQGLREKFRQGEISRQEFLDEMKNLQVKDDQGRLWMIGSQSGKWYYLKGQEWVQAEPEIKKESKGACPYCGFENKLGAEACARCGGGLRGSEDYCIQCGAKLSPPLYRCPKCDALSPGATPTTVPTPSAVAPTAPSPAPPQAPAQVPAQAVLIPEKKPAPQPEKKPIQGEFVLKSVSAHSFALFGGAVGIVFGIILGAFIGATDFLAAQTAKLPGFLTDMQGTLIGAVVYAAAGGLISFLALGLLAWLKAHFINILLSFIGGIKVNLDQVSAGPRRGKRAGR